MSTACGHGGTGAVFKGWFMQDHDEMSLQADSADLAKQLKRLAVCRFVPDAVVRGLQLGLGLSLATKGVKNVWFKVAEVS